MYENETVWTDIVGIGPEISTKFAVDLAKIGIELDTGKQWCFWKQNGAKFDLGMGNPLEIAGAVRKVLDGQ